MSGLNSLATIIKRLEAATSRLEDLAQEGSPRTSGPSNEIAGIPQTTHTSTPSAAPAAPASASVAVSASAAPGAELENPPVVAAFVENVIDGKLKPFLELTRSFASDSVKEQVALVEKEFNDLRSLLLIAATCQKPDQKTFGELLTPLQADIEAISRLKEANRKDREWLTHLTTIAEGATVVGWVTIEPKPGQYVGDIKDSVQFYGNRVIKEFKDKDAKHAEWVKGYIGVLEETRLYIMKHHTTGLVWNPRGIPVSQYQAPSAAPAADAPPPPPPPPPGPPPPPVLPSGTSSSELSGTAAVFAQLNRGEDVTKGLRKVDKSEMTHKNPALRASSVVSAAPAPSSASKRPAKPTKPASLAGKKPAKLALEGSKWIVEYQENEPALTIENAEINQLVNLFGCKNSTIIIKGKVNAVTLLNCTKTSVLVGSVVSSVSITNSPSFTVQITGKAPTIQIDTTDSGQIYLSKDCLDVEITTAKCSSINVSLPVEGEEDGVFEEQPVPEMLKTVVQKGKLVTTIVEHAG